MRSVRQRLCAPKHLRAAWKAISKRKRDSHGIDGVTIKQFSQSLDRQIQSISEDLKTKAYRFTAARGALLHKSGTAKKRPIKIPAVRDRVVLKALSLLIEHRFKKYDLSCSYGYVKGRGPKDAIQRVRELASQGNTVVLEADIHKFFDSVDREILIGRFIRQIKLRSLESMIREALTVELGNLGSFTDEEQQMFPAADSGIPQGGVLSPMLANFYLHPFDKTMLDKGFNLVRYADDFVVMCKTEAEAKSAFDVCQQVLERELHLKLHPLGVPGSKTRILRFERGLKFLGTHFTFRRVTPADSVIVKFRERIETILDTRQGKSLLQTLTSLRNTVVGWGQCYRDLDVLPLYTELDCFVKEQVSRYLRELAFLSRGFLLNKDQLRVLGIPRLEKMARQVRDLERTAFSN
jgi:RNA-directed DNA polymerase